MAYNFKNALVNLNEEIRKNNSGGDLPAVKLAVSQLQVSMAAVKSSVSNVSAQVAAIQATLESLNPSTTEQVIGEWIDGSPLYSKWVHVTSLPANADTPVDVGLTNVSVKRIEGYAEIVDGENHACIMINYTISSTDRLLAYYNYATNRVVIVFSNTSYTASDCYIRVVYTKNTLHKKGGKK